MRLNAATSGLGKRHPRLADLAEGVLPAKMRKHFAENTQAQEDALRDHPELAHRLAPGSSAKQPKKKQTYISTPTLRPPGH